jgi:hypothetical protein
MGDFVCRALMRAKLLSAAVAAIMATLCMTAAAASAAPQANKYGVISSMNGFSLSEASPAEWGLQLAAMRQNGIQELRSDAAWGVIEPNAPAGGGPTFQFASTDAWVTALALNHITWEPILDYNNTWAMAARDNGDFATFAQAVAARYGAGGSFWAQNPQLPYLPVQIFELWNEEGGGQFYISPQDYGPLYVAVHSAIHAIDPSASVDLGGLGVGGVYNQSKDYPSWYLVYLFGYYPQLEQTIDGYGLHPYGATATDSAEWVVDFRHTLSHYHVSTSVPIDLTEFGWPYTQAQESWRAAQMNALGAAFSRSNCGIREAAPYDWINPNAPSGSDFGFVDSGGASTALRASGNAWFNAFAQYSQQPTFVIC